MKFLAVIFLSLLPMSAFAGTLVELAIRDSRLTTLVQALQITGLDSAIAAASPDAPLTVFAPTNDAFQQLPHGVLDSLLSNPEALAEVLKQHVVAGRFEADRLLLRRVVPSLSSPLEVSNTIFGILRVNANIEGQKGKAVQFVQEDILASNGVIQVIDGVILKP